MTAAILLASLEWKNARATRQGRPVPAIHFNWDTYAIRERRSTSLAFGSNQPRQLAEDRFYFEDLFFLNPRRAS